MAKFDKFQIRGAIHYSKYEKDSSVEKLSVADIIFCHQYISLGIEMPGRTYNKLVAIIDKINRLKWEPGIARYNSEMALEIVRGNKVIKID